MKQYILFIFLFIPLFSSCQEKYNQEPYDDFEVLLRTSDINQDFLPISAGWQKRDSLSYLRFKDYVTQINIIDTDTIPNWITSFKNVEVLLATASDTLVLPDNIDKLSNLKSLNVGNNTILKNLKPTIANLTGNNYLLNSLDKYSKLSALSLYHIDSIPQNLYNLKELDYLVLLDCNINSLSPMIINLQNIETLDISDNPMTSLPKELLELPKLRKIYYDEDKITNEDFKRKLYEHVEKNRVAYRKQQMLEEQREYEKSKFE